MNIILKCNSLYLGGCIAGHVVSTPSCYFVVVVRVIEVASVIELSEASGRVAAGLCMTEG